MSTRPKNPLVLFDNHFLGHRRHYPLRTQIAVAADLGYDGYEFHEIDPDDEEAWEAAGDALAEHGLSYAGMYVVVRVVNDDEVERREKELERVERLVERLAQVAPRAYLNLALASNPSGHNPIYHESGSAYAEERHWRRAAEFVCAVDAALERRGVEGCLYNHVWFMTDTPQACVRIIDEAGAKVMRPALASFHAHFHEGVADPEDLLHLPGMERLGYVALLNAWPKPGPFRTMPIDAGNIDMAQLLAHLWRRGYDGPLVAQGYDQGGDPYVTAERSISYVMSVWSRLKRNPRLDPTAPDA